MPDDIELSPENILDRDIFLKFLEQRGNQPTEVPPIPTDRPELAVIPSPDRLVLKSLINVYATGGCSYSAITDRVRKPPANEPIMVVDLDTRSEDASHEIIPPSESRRIARRTFRD